MKVIRRVFRTLHVNGQQVPNVLFLDLNVDILDTFPKFDSWPIPQKEDTSNPNISQPTGW